MKNLFSIIKQIAQQNKEGFTIDITTLKTPKKGWCVALKETQNCFNDEGLSKVLEIAKTTTNIVGGWLDDDKFYFDAVMLIEDREEAIQAGKENEQLAIYNLETREYIIIT